MISKAKEILETGTLTGLNKYNNKEEVVVCKELEKVLGVGAKRAKDFYDKGVKSVADLRKRTDLHNNHIEIGLKYFE